jgi:hypothetical protein
MPLSSENAHDLEALADYFAARLEGGKISALEIRS